jgi:hypothetical protein
MADDKKKDAKGPPKKDAKPADGGGGTDTLSRIIGLVVVLVLVAYLLSGKNLASDEAPTWGELLSGEGAPAGSPLYGATGGPEGELAAGTEVVNTEDATVRVDLSAAARAGEQPARAKGKVRQGPVEAFGREWYFVDYEEAPDGWVESSQITDEVGKYTAFHIVPIVFDFLRPLAIGLALAVGIGVAAVWWRSRREEEMGERRAAEAHRAYLERTGRAAPVASNLASAAGRGDAPANLPGDGAVPVEWGAPVAKPPRENERWVHVKALLTSAATSDWRQAIIEADIMLEEMLRAIGYDGVTIGDMLKNVDPADFVTLDKAWEAHKVRNQIAHRGLDFRVDRGDAERVIKLYEDVFREFNYL